MKQATTVGSVPETRTEGRTDGLRDRDAEGRSVGVRVVRVGVVGLRDGGVRECRSVVWDGGVRVWE